MFGGTRQNYEVSEFHGPILLVLGFGLLFSGFYTYYGESAFSRQATRTLGTIASVRTGDTDNHGISMYTITPEYHDTQRHAHRLINRFRSDSPVYHPGESVTILYSPDDPENAVIDRGGWNHWLSFLLGFLGLWFVAAGLSYVRTCSRQRRIFRNGSNIRGRFDDVIGHDE